MPSRIRSSLISKDVGAPGQINNQAKKGDRPKASLLKNQSRARVDAGFMTSPLVRLAVAVAAGAVATIGAWLRLVDVQRTTIQVLAIEATNGRSSFVRG